MAVPQTNIPKQGDTASVSAMKASLALIGQTAAPAPPAGSGLTTLVPKQGDSLQTSLRKVNGLLVQGAGGGGGITTETDPLSVHTTGGTMTGTLNVPEVDIPSGGVKLLPSGYGGLSVSPSIDVLAPNKIVINQAAYPNIQLIATNPCQIILTSNGQSSLASILFKDNATADTVQLSMNASGDIVLNATAGPNAGKAVNLTTGKWA